MSHRCDTRILYTSTFSTESSFGIEGGPPVKAPTLIAALRTEVLRGTADPIVRETDAGTLRLVQEDGEVADALDETRDAQRRLTPRPVRPSERQRAVGPTIRSVRDESG